MVTLRKPHAVICGIDGRPDVELGLPELMLIQALATDEPVALAPAVQDVAERSGADADRLWALLGELDARKLLVDDRADARDEDRLPASDVHAPALEYVKPPGESGDDMATGLAARGSRLDADAILVVPTPLVFRVGPQGFEYVDHDGRVRVRLDAAHFAAAITFRRPRAVGQAYTEHRTELGASSLSEPQFTALVERLTTSGLLRQFDPEGPDSRENRVARAVMRSVKRLGDRVNLKVAEHLAAEAEREARTATKRIKVVPVEVNGNPIPLALGMLIASAKAYDGGRLEERYRFPPEWLTRDAKLASMAEEPGIYLFSNYIWSHPKNMAVSRRLKDLSPASVTIHGGPDTPKYETDVEAYLLRNPHVDIAVRGEGEATLAEVLDALKDSVGAGPPDLSVLRDVPGVAFREGDRVIRTADRERIADLDSIPSPFLTGVYEVFDDTSPMMAIVETNRGCPYGCTFCDWGSATLSRIRRFDLDRVFAELEWCAQRRVSRIFIADANFGILERDVQIAEKVAELKGIYGYPRVFTTSYAKNTVKHLRKIVETLAEADILSLGLLSLQSMDTGTLDIINRSNIKTEKYEDLAHEFRKAKLPLFIDLMLGLPGATRTSFRNDLQGCVDREVTAKIYPTELLVNSPMNDPAYKQKFRIETSAPPMGFDSTVNTAYDGWSKRALLVSTSSYTREDYEEMLQLREAFVLCENFAVLRQVSRYVRQELGLAEVDFYERARLDSRAAPDRWPTMSFAFRVVPSLGAPPVSWRLFIDEVHDYLTSVLGVADDSALRTVLTVQHALLPARDRRFPVALELAHDYAAWHAAMEDAKDGAHRDDWPDVVPRLRDLPPATFVVEDPNQVCDRGMGYHIIDNLDADWELHSPVARPMPSEHRDIE
jgi:hypothetical protein